MQQEPVC
jgi:putative acetyltransferase